MAKIRSYYIEPDQHKKLKRIAQIKNKSISQLVSEILIIKYEIDKETASV